MVRLFLKLYGPLLIAVAVIMILQAKVFGYVTSRYGSENVRLSFQSVFNLVERELARTDEARWDQAFAELKPGFGHPVALKFIEQLAARLPASDSRMSQLREGRIVLMGEADDGYSVARRIGEGDRVLVLTFTESRHIRGNITKLNTLVQLVVLTLLLVFWVWPLLRDMRKLQLAAHEIGGGRFHAPVALGRWSVLADLQRAISAMAGQIAKQLQAQKALTGGISHELRNPLMRIQYRHRLAQDAATLSAKDDYLNAMQGDLDAMHGLVDEVLVFSKMEYQEARLVLQSQPVAPLLDALTEGFESLAAAQGKRVTLEVRSNTDACHMDLKHMERAAGNLLSNAARFAASRVALTLTRVDGKNELAVEDDGPGINPADAERVFRPFERLDESRDRATGGFGLGLAIVREVARLHGGAVSVEQGALGGAHFVLRWSDAPN